MIKVYSSALLFVLLATGCMTFNKNGSSQYPDFNEAMLNVSRVDIRPTLEKRVVFNGEESSEVKTDSVSSSDERNKYFRFNEMTLCKRVSCVGVHPDRTINIEYSRHDVEGFTPLNFISIITVFIVPYRSVTEYRVKAKVVNKDGKLLDTIELSDRLTRYSGLLIPFTFLFYIGPGEEGVFNDLVKGVMFKANKVGGI